MSSVPPRPRKRFIVVGVVLFFLVAVLASARFYTDVLWFQEVGFSDVLWTSIRTQALVGVGVGLAVAVLIWLNLWIAARVEPAYRISVASNRRSALDDLERYREAIGPYLRWIRIGVALFIGLIAGAGAASAWEKVLLWINRIPFGRTDPQFGRDIGFYMFELPFLEQVLDWLWFALIAAVFLSLAAHLFNGSIRPEGGLRGVQSGALAHISVLLGLLAITKAAQYWLGQYALNFSERGVVTGASYTDVNAQLFALKLLAIISIISALLFIVNIRFRSLVLPLAALGIWILTAFLAGGVWPAAVQYFSVRPQEVQREAPYIARNISETLFAFGLDDVDTQTFPADETLDAEGIEANRDVLENVRLWDPPILGEAYAQLQAIKPYYQFADVDVDRYEVDGKMRQVLLSGRELSLDDIPEGAQTWSNLHFQYTHGYGLVASLANEQTTAGQPSFLVKDVPGTVSPGAEALLPDEPRLYYAEVFEDDEYSIVNSGQAEIDYPTQDGVERSNYAGEGGVRIGGFLNQIAFAIRESDPNLILSNLVTADSKILLYRDIRDRIARAAPFLSLDRDPYPAVVDGRTVWILDAYTTSEWFPYGQRFDMDELISDANAAGDSLTNTLSGRVNYIRNSVKVVVDAYDGTMKFYVVDDSDPLIEAWRGVFPDLFTDEEPSTDLQAHFRYPEDLFTIQSEVYREYHVEEPGDFYAGGEAWEVADTPDRNVGTTETSPGEDVGLVSPSYLLFELPQETQQEFVLARPFTPSNRNNMVSMMVARSDPENYGELISLEFPSARLVPGPAQVDNLINQDVEISQTLTLLGQEGSDIRYGKQVILPIEDSLLYVQPLFVTAESLGIPELKKVAVVYGEEVVLADNFDDAVTDLFDLEPTEPTEPTGPTPPDRPDRPQPSGGDDEAERLLDRAADIYGQMQDALSEGDLERYAQLEERLGAILIRAERVSN
jgi:uncharacterized protein